MTQAKAAPAGYRETLVPARDRLTSIPSPQRPASPLVSVVIPTLNEADNLPHVLPRIPAWVNEVVIVDGRSIDRTVEVALELRPDAHIVLEKRPGKGTALLSGFRAAKGDIIVALDADGSTNPEEIPAFVGLLLAGADFVKGSRFLQGGGTADMELHRQLGNWGLRMIVRLVFGGRYSDLCYGYNAFWKDALPVLRADVCGFEIETLMNVRALRSRLNVAEVPSFEDRRINGESHLQTLPDGWRVLRTIASERWPYGRKSRAARSGAVYTLRPFSRPPQEKLDGHKLNRHLNSEDPLVTDR